MSQEQTDLDPIGMAVVEAQQRLREAIKKDADKHKRQMKKAFSEARERVQA